ncbi:hypothetical protein O1B25_002345 [Vibrio cholerae]|nr:hypothetical protein [Vibrio cholerae]
MAAFGGYPQNVTFSTVNVAKGGGSENLLINPRGKINQLNEPDGVLSAGVYFCDGWKAGASGAEVYRDADGFRLISGSIVQLVPNNLGAGRNIRANMDIISGSPVMSINGGSDNVVSSDSEFINLEISGNNSKFNRVILAESLEIPVYQQSADELEPCLKFCYRVTKDELSPQSSAGILIDEYQTGGGYGTYTFSLPKRMYSNPAVTFDLSIIGNVSSWSASSGKDAITLLFRASTTGWMNYYFKGLIADARP